MKKGDVVQFRRLVRGEYNGVEKQLYMVEETNLKYGEINISVRNLKTNELVYTVDTMLVLAKDTRVNIQLTLF